jgi:hypothetical protein
MVTITRNFSTLYISTGCCAAWGWVSMETNQCEVLGCRSASKWEMVQFITSDVEAVFGMIKDMHLQKKLSGFWQGKRGGSSCTQWHGPGSGLVPASFHGVCHAVATCSRITVSISNRPFAKCHCLQLLSQGN